MVLILENHLLPSFGDYDSLGEKLVQESYKNWRMGSVLKR